MRDANSQRGNSMIPVCAPVQPPSPHVSHAETEGETSNPPSLLRSFGEARRAEAFAKAGARSGAYQDFKSRRPALRLADHEIAENLHPRHGLQFFGIDEISIQLN
ncbi:MAG: hypothetical protein QOD89_1820 [Bradyrhizobium sp.]|nr:hypothetical protein [Bradyrhizobium sp.]